MFSGSRSAPVSGVISSSHSSRGKRRQSMARSVMARSVGSPRCPTPGDLRADTALTPDPDRRGSLPRRHPRRLEGRVRLRRRQHVHRAARDAGGARPARARRSSPRTRSSSRRCRPVRSDRRRGAARRPHRVAGRGRPARARRRARRCACTACSGARTTRTSRSRTSPVPEVPLPAPDRRRRTSPTARTRSAQIKFHEQTEWRPVSPLDDPGPRPVRVVGAADARAAPRRRLARPARARRARRRARPRGRPRPRPARRAVHGAVARDRHPLRRDARRRRGCCRRSRRGTSATATRPAPRVSGTKTATSARSRPRPRTCACSRSNRRHDAQSTCTPVRMSGGRATFEDRCVPSGGVS